MNSVFIDVDHSLIPKSGEAAAGDCFLSRKGRGGDRLISVLSDGLGSGIKAGVLSSLTATMALRTIEHQLSADRAAELIARTLPVCRERKISYATFTLVDIKGVSGSGNVRLIEYENPEALFFRGAYSAEIPRKVIPCRGSLSAGATGMEACFSAVVGDRLIFFSDGVTQSGLGTPRFPLGWGLAAVKDYIRLQIEADPMISSRKLARRITARSLQNDGGRARDDISCGVVYFRRPRKMIIATGPPYKRAYDASLARKIETFEGRKVLCGGTTATIVARERRCAVEVDLKNWDDSLPPVSRMEGIDLVSEGILTLGMVCEFLEKGIPSSAGIRHPARRIVEMMFDSDVIHILAGTRINEAHQDPNMPVELEIRRNIVKKIQSLLQEHYLKEVPLQFI